MTSGTTAVRALRLRHRWLVLAAAAALVVGAAVPTWAAVARDATFWGHGPPVADGPSTLTIGAYSWTVPDTGGACGTGEPASIRLDVDDPANGAIKVPWAGFSIAPLTLTVGGSDFQLLVYQVSDTTGTITLNPDGPISWNLSLRFKIRSCSGTSDWCTTNTVAGTVSGFYSGTAAGGTRAGAAHVYGSTGAMSLFPGCSMAVSSVLDGQVAHFDLMVDI